MQKFPTLYNRELADDDDMSSMVEAETQAEAAEPSSTDK